MRLEMDHRLTEGLTGPTQMARRVTESWAAEAMYCLACPAKSISSTPPNTKVVDFVCAKCQASYQLKAGKSWSERRVPDGAFHTMITAVREGTAPHLLLMQYTPEWRVRNLMLVPSFFLAESAIRERPPINPGRRRAGWIGCDIILDAIAEDGKVRLVENYISSPPRAVRERFDRICALAQLPATKRGWTLDVLAIVRRLTQSEFVLSDIYAHQSELAALHPNNKNIRPKIRQQLQVLRDMNLLRFEGRGRYRLTDDAPPR